MPSLETGQRAMMRAIMHGPDHVPAAMFSGGRAAALRGLAVHANTISHARLVALEDSFPRTREVMGDAGFNRLSRSYLDRPGISALPLAMIGAQFAEHLADYDAAALAVDLARFEWAWLGCYHAADEAAFTLADLAGLGEAELLDLVIRRHPASALVELGEAALVQLSEECETRLTSPAVLITRPEAEVLVSPANEAASAMFRAFARPQAVCNLLAEDAEPERENALIALIASGALARAKEGGEPC
ncbi:MAG: putative DNA-binding domain-containing protein [Sphingomonadales bacterium]|nr:putative DNA-binding domain-containing protein [Sphingomonadales bacterium]MDE2169311.1 putative DNA-binding domain-containing protein [Sphingomonadales bacterium]